MADYPIPVNHFQVEWGGTRIGFSEVSGLNIEVPIIEYREGASPVYSPLKMPGSMKYSNIVLKRGIMPSDNEFFDWLNTIRLNQVERRNLVISVSSRGDKVHNISMQFDIQYSNALSDSIHYYWREITILLYPTNAGSPSSITRKITCKLLPGTFGAIKNACGVCD